MLFLYINGSICWSVCHTEQVQAETSSMRSCSSITVKTVTFFRCNDYLVISVKILTTLLQDLNSTQGKQEIRRKMLYKIKAGKIIIRERLPEKLKLIAVPAHSFAFAEWHSRRLICITDLHIWVFVEPGYLQKSHSRSLTADLIRLWVGFGVGRGEWGGGIFCSLIWNLWTVISQYGFLWKTGVLEWHSSEESLCFISSHFHITVSTEECSLWANSLFCRYWLFLRSSRVLALAWHPAFVLHTVELNWVASRMSWALSHHYRTKVAKTASFKVPHLLVLEPWA